MPLKIITVLIMLAAFIALPIISDHQLDRAFGISVQNNSMSILAGAIDLFVGICGASVAKRGMAALFGK